MDGMEVCHGVLEWVAGVLGDLCSIWWVTSLIELSIADAKFLESHPK